MTEMHGGSVPDVSVTLGEQTESRYPSFDGVVAWRAKRLSTKLACVALNR